MIVVIISGTLLSILAACTSSTPVNTAETASPAESNLPSPSLAVPSTTSSLTPEPTTSSTPLPLAADFWQELPVIPETISDRVREIYRLGLSMGNNRHIFSRIGDCNSAAPDFLVGFDGNYDLGEYTSLQPAIDYFQGSFERPSIAAKNGLNAAGLLTTIWTPKDICLSNETLLDCQYRLDHPSFAIISIGSNEAYYVHHDGPATFEKNMRQIIEDTIAKGIVPILSTKADNIEGDNSINPILARIALEYELPLWNFWLATQPLPDKGMSDGAHLNSVSYVNFTDFSIPHSLDYGKQVHNLTALQMLDFLREQLGGISPDGEIATQIP